MSTAPAPAPVAAQSPDGAAAALAQRSNDRTPRQPEKKIGPFAGGVGVAIWLNQAEGQDGSVRAFRSLTINPRRYFDDQSRQWKDATSFNPTDLPALIFCLQKAQEFVFETPLPGSPSGAAPADGTTAEVPEVPF